jgi:hypothetical protein
MQWNLPPSFSYASPSHKYCSFIVVTINLTPLQFFLSCSIPVFIIPFLQGLQKLQTEGSLYYANLLQYGKTSSLASISFTFLKFSMVLHNNSYAVQPNTMPIQRSKPCDVMPY